MVDEGLQTPISVTSIKGRWQVNEGRMQTYLSLRSVILPQKRALFGVSHVHDMLAA